MELKINKSLIGYEKVSYISDDDSKHPKIELDCALGTNPFGCSEQVNKALTESEDSSIYPNYPYTETLKALSTFWSKICPLKPSNFRLYAGSVAGLDAVCRILGSVSLGFSPQFTEFKGLAITNSGSYETVETAPDCKFDESRLIEAISKRHSLVYIDNPNNPTGQVISLKQIEKVLEKAKKSGAAVLVDEAYADYIEDSESAISLLKSHDNLIVVRSFSKGYGLAGLRVGYAACSEELQDYLRKAGLPFAVSSRSAKVAVTALADQDFLKYTRTEVAKIKSKILSKLTKLKIMETDPRTPIMALKDSGGANLYEKLLEKGVLTEFGPEVGLDEQCVRLRVHRECDRLIEILNSI